MPRLPLPQLAWITVRDMCAHWQACSSLTLTPPLIESHPQVHVLIH
jgi:hypothetical protein